MDDGIRGRSSRPDGPPKQHSSTQHGSTQPAPATRSGRRSRVQQRRRLLVAGTGVVVLALVVGVVVAVLGHHPAARPTVAASSAAGTPTATASPSLPVNGVALDPAYYADGACRMYPPTAGDRHATVFLDAGHGGPDTGGEGKTDAGKAVDESTLTLAVATDAAARVRAAGYVVVLSRTTASSVVRLTPSETTSLGHYTYAASHRDIAGRDRCANLAKADALVSVHFNVGGRNSYGGALTTFDAARPFAQQNKKLATLLQAAMAAQLAPHGVQDRGLILDSQVGHASTAAGKAYPHLLILGPAKAGYFDTPSLMPGALVEPLFLSNPAEATLAASAAGQQAIATAVADAVEQFLGQGG